MGAFADYTHQLVPFASGWLLTVIVWAATATEATLGVLLLTGWRPKLVGAATEDVPSSVELRWRPGEHQAALT
jgi:hypothetical protein